MNHPKTVLIVEDEKNISDVIVVNRMSDEIRDVEEKVYTRDIYTRD